MNGYAIDAISRGLLGGYRIGRDIRIDNEERDKKKALENDLKSAMDAGKLEESTQTAVGELRQGDDLLENGEAPLEQVKTFKVGNKIINPMEVKRQTITEQKALDPSTIVKPDTMDNSDVGQPGEAPLQTTQEVKRDVYCVGAREFAERGLANTFAQTEAQKQAQKEAQRLSSPYEVMRRQSQAYLKHGDAAKAAALLQTADQGEEADYQKQTKQFARDAAQAFFGAGDWSGAERFMSESKGDGNQYKMIPNPQTNAVDVVQINPDTGQKTLLKSYQNDEAGKQNAYIDMMGVVNPEMVMNHYSGLAKGRAEAEKARFEQGMKVAELGLKKDDNNRQWYEAKGKLAVDQGRLGLDATKHRDGMSLDWAKYGADRSDKSFERETSMLTSQMKDLDGQIKSLSEANPDDPRIADLRAQKESYVIEYDMAAKNAGGIGRVLQAGAGFNVVERPDGTVVKQDGARNWRNNNPGNIEYGDFAKKMGAIGSDGRFAIFPSYEQGRDAKANLIFNSGSYSGKKLTDAISRYAPAFENDTKGYQSEVLKAVGGKNVPMSQYTPAEQNKILAAMERVEGYKKGKETVLKEGSKNSTAPAATKQASAAQPAAVENPLQGLQAQLQKLEGAYKEINSQGVLRPQDVIAYRQQKQALQTQMNQLRQKEWDARIAAKNSERQAKQRAQDVRLGLARQGLGLSFNRQLAQR